VVIAVIPILAALLLPALGRAKIAANNAVCVSNLRQQGIGLTMYVDDFGAYPPYRVPTLARPNGWIHVLSPYVKDKWPANNWKGGTYAGAPGSHWASPPKKSVFACPGHDRIRGVYATASQGIAGAYAYNGGAPLVQGSPDRRIFTDGGLGGQTNGQPVRESAIISPSQMIAIGDSTLMDSITPVGGTLVETGVLLGLTYAPHFPTCYLPRP